MRNTYVVVADASHAKVLTLRARETMGDAKPTQLVQVTELEHPERRHRPSEIFSDSRPGLHASFGVGARHGLDDGRSDEMAESDRRFAKEILDTVHDLVTDQPATLVMAAGPTMLGHLRKVSSPWLDSLEVHELRKHLVRLSPVEIHDYLAKHELLPVRERAV